MWANTKKEKLSYAEVIFCLVTFSKKFYEIKSKMSNIQAKQISTVFFSSHDFVITLSNTSSSSETEVAAMRI